MGLQEWPNIFSLRDPPIRWGWVGISPYDLSISVDCLLIGPSTTPRTGSNNFSARRPGTVRNDLFGRIRLLLEAHDVAQGEVAEETATGGTAHLPGLRQILAVGRLIKGTVLPIHSRVQDRLIGS